MKRMFWRFVCLALLLTSLTTIANLTYHKTLALPTSNVQVIAQATKFNSTEFARTVTHRTAEVNGVRLHYVIGGKGNPVVLLHGFPQTWYEWHQVMPALAQRYTVIAPDLRGLGDSSKPETGYDATTVAEDIFQLTTRLGFQRIYLVGHDIAGAVV